MSTSDSIIPAGPPAGTRPPAPVAMLDCESFAELLGVSARHVRRLVDAGKCPPPVKLGACVRWPRPVVETWIADNCPPCRRRQGGAR
jgi:predicted DNA-binding transcriptional regulator AlpA